MDKMKIIITMLSMILLVSLISAGEIDTDAGTNETGEIVYTGERYVEFEHTFSNGENETYKFQSHYDYCKLNCSKTEWQAYVDKDLNRYITDKEFDINNPDETQEINVGNETFISSDYEESSSWLVATIRELIIKIDNLFSFNTEQDTSIGLLEEENTLLKDELCKKDSTYSWCKNSIEPK